MPTSENSSPRRRAAHFAPKVEESAPTPTESTGVSSAAPSDTMGAASTMADEVASAAPVDEAPMPYVEATPLVQVDAVAAGQTDAVPMVPAAPDTGSLPGPRAVAGASRMSERTARATQRAAAAHQRRNGGARNGSEKSHALPFMALLAIVGILIVVGMGALVVPNLFKHEPDAKESYKAGEQVIVVIPDGSSGATIAQILVENHVLDDENIFYQEVASQNADSLLKSGTYQFITGATPSRS